jgi:hypothetical protein
MAKVTSKTLREETAQTRDRAGQSERDPEWSEIMVAVWKAQKRSRGKRRNPVLNERQRRNYAARLR